MFVKKVFRLIMITILINVVMINVAFAEDFPTKKEWFEQVINNPLPYYGPTDDPPPAPVTAVAEWEPATGVSVSWPLTIPVELIAEMAEDVEVWTTVVSEQQIEEALSLYIHAGVDTSNCFFLFINSYIGPYTRDHGPWYIINGDDEQGMICNQYLGPVNWMPLALGDTLGIPVYETGMNSEGGNYQTDGMGRAIVTHWVYMENQSLTPEEIDQIMFDYLGITSHIVRECSNVHLHVDTWAKLLDPGRILVIIPNGGDPLVEENVDYFETLLSAYGRPYEVVRVQGSGYSNTLFLNNKVLVPQFGDATDSLALVTWGEAMPGYEVQGYYYGSFNYGDALHCRTHEMADRYMLRIVHVPVHDLENDGNDYFVEANVHAYSNEPLIGTPYIVWNVNGGAYNYTPMTSLGGDYWAGYIPQQPDGSDIYYYIEAEDATGRIENHPYIGEGNPHHFEVGPDTEAPVVEFEMPMEILSVEWPMEVTVYALDNRWISSVTFECSINGAPQDDVELPLEEPYAVYYTGMTLGNVQPGDILDVRVKVVDISQNMNTTYWPETGYHTINVASPPNVTVELTPSALPIQIPANGGSFDYTIEVNNNTTLTYTFDFWMTATMPDSSEYGPLYQVNGFSAQGMFSFSADRTQAVPANAPAGVYSYNAFIGTYADIVWTMDSFVFEKLSTGDGGEIAYGWECYGEEFDAVAVEMSIPSEFMLYQNYPNPFNANTVISYKLQADSYVELVVYDVMGREVQLAVSSWQLAGEHQVVWDASEQASGVYFAVMKANGFSLTRKLLLVK